MFVSSGETLKIEGNLIMHCEHVELRQNRVWLIVAKKTFRRYMFGLKLKKKHVTYFN
jgi:hypothetical protein